MNYVFVCVTRVRINTLALTRSTKNVCEKNALMSESDVRYKYHKKWERINLQSYMQNVFTVWNKQK